MTRGPPTRVTSVGIHVRVGEADEFFEGLRLAWRQVARAYTQRKSDGRLCAIVDRSHVRRQSTHDHRRGVIRQLSQDNKLVAAQPRHHVSGPERLTECFSGRDDRRRSSVVTIRVVDLLQAVDVHVEHGG